MSKDEELENQHKTEVSRWRKNRLNAEDAHEAAVAGMRKFLKSALKQQDTHRNIATELRDYIRGVRTGKIPTRGGFDGNYEDPDGVISPEGIRTVTGYGAKPWLDHEDDDDSGLF